MTMEELRSQTENGKISQSLVIAENCYHLRQRDRGKEQCYQTLGLRPFAEAGAMVIQLSGSWNPREDMVMG